MRDDHRSGAHALCSFVRGAAGAAASCSRRGGIRVGVREEDLCGTHMTHFTATVLPMGAATFMTFHRMESAVNTGVDEVTVTLNTVANRFLKPFRTRWLV